MGGSRGKTPKVKTPVSQPARELPEPTEFTFDQSALSQADPTNVPLNQEGSETQQSSSSEIAFLRNEFQNVANQFVKFAPLLERLSKLHLDDTAPELDRSDSPATPLPEVPPGIEIPQDQGVANHDQQLQAPVFQSQFPDHFNSLEFTPHEFYSHYIKPGFSNRGPLYCNTNKPHVFRFTDSVTRALTGTKYQAKLTEYMLVSNYGYFTSCANAEMLAALEEIEDLRLPPDAQNAICALRRSFKSHLQIEDMLRERLFFLATQSDPEASVEDKDFNTHVVRYRFQPDPRDQGMPSDLQEDYENYKRQVALSRAHQAAKAEAKRQLSSGTGGGARGGGSGSGSLTSTGEAIDKKERKDGGKGGRKDGKNPQSTTTTTTTTTGDKVDQKDKGGKGTKTVP